MTSLTLVTDERELLQAYAYSYPHKSSYCRLTPSIPISAIWQDEDIRHLSLYVHVPFCEMRCGFCNLFTQSQPGGDTVDKYLHTLVRQMKVIRNAIPGATFGQFAVGGGTPTFLSVNEVEHIFRSAEKTFEFSIEHLPTSVETSPATATVDKLRMLRDFGVQRISIGVQSFVEEDAKDLGRPQRLQETHRALQTIRDTAFPVLNIDLIYGDPAQSMRSWARSLTEALIYRPEELYLYPLYIRPETGLARAGHRIAQHRSDLYCHARDFLKAEGYEQASLRCFRRPENLSPSSYVCQRDGMIGLGCGARSYTRQLHYATRFAVTQAGVKAILGDWIAQSDEQLLHATHGIALSANEQRRRFLIMSMLQAKGMSIPEYRAQFQSSPFDDCPELNALLSRSWLDQSSSDVLRLTDEGLEHSDEVGPLLYSQSVRRCLQDFVRF